MRCPDPDLLLDAIESRSMPAALVAHLETCQSCRATWRTLQEIPALLRPDTGVDDDLLDSAMKGVQAGLRAEERWARRFHTPAAGLAAAFGAAAILLFLGAGGTRAGPLLLLLASLAVGSCLMVYGWVWGWKPRRKKDEDTHPGMG